jgi:hypothetical protein
MEMCNESFHEVLKALVGTLGVDDDGILGDVVDAKIFHWRWFNLGGIHCEELQLKLRDMLGRCRWIGRGGGGGGVIVVVVVQASRVEKGKVIMAG